MLVSLDDDVASRLFNDNEDPEKFLKLRSLVRVDYEYCLEDGESGTDSTLDSHRSVNDGSKVVID